MSEILNALNINADKSIKLAEVELGLELRGDDLAEGQAIQSPDEAALQACKSSHVYTSGPFVGFHRVLYKGSTPEEADIFRQKVGMLNGRMLLMPTSNGRIYRTLITLGDDGVVNLASFGAETRFKPSDNERTVLSAVRGFYSGDIGSHATGTVKAEPGHITLTSGVVLGSYHAQDIHAEVHSIVDSKKNTNSNILLATSRNERVSTVGVSIPSREYTYETWPRGLELLWHPEDGSPEVALSSGSMKRVQAAGFVALRTEGKIQQVMNILENMH